MITKTKQKSIFDDVDEKNEIENEFIFIDVDDKLPEDNERVLFIMTRNHHLSHDMKVLYGRYRKSQPNSYNVGYFIFGVGKNEVSFSVKKQNYSENIVAWCKIPQIPQRYESTKK